MLRVEEQLEVARVPGWNVSEIDRWLSNEGSIAHLQQNFNGIEIVGTTITVELDTKGEIIRINRVWVPESEPTCSFDSEVAEQRALSEWGVDDLKAVYYPKSGGSIDCAFMHKDEIYTYIVSREGEKLLESDGLIHWDNAKADVRHRTFSNNTNFPTSGDQISRLNIGRENVWLSSECRFVLADHYSQPHTLGRVMDDNGLE